MHLITRIIQLLSLTLFSCVTQADDNLDWHTQSNYTQIISTHVHLDLSVDFKQKQLSGYIEHTLKRLAPDVTELKLDTRDLTILKVEHFDNQQWHKGEFALAKETDFRGSQLVIKLKPQTTKIRVYYHSTPEASGLQWLSPAQTAGKKHPFMFSQSQAIHARSWMPIQDTPAMRVSYSATIRTDKHLRPVMSADNNPQWHDDGIYQFTMPQPIPPYLIAIAAGNIHHKTMSKQTAIYSEPEYLDVAAKEFEDTQAMIDATEKLYGEYRWNQYDLLILPPSFPFGGMENPRLSFITPTVIAGDKSLVNLIAHELAHSWSGNLVTNATWRDLWLNEGFTSYVENRIMESVFGKKRAMMERTLDSQGLRQEVEELDESDTILHIAMQGRDPDDAFSGIPYTKGHLFLWFLEQRFGREKFDLFLKAYFDNHAFQSIDTRGFIAYLDKHLISQYPGKVTIEEVKTWIFKPGLPTFTPLAQSDTFTKVQQHMDSWLSNRAALSDIPTKQWTVHEWLYFINNLPEEISKEQLALLDKTYQLTLSTNNEIAHAWLLLSLQKKYYVVNQRLENYLISIGRRKLIVPLYEALISDEKTRPFAVSIYQKARAGYHPLAQSTIDALFTEYE
ncbi:M1 family metallopeptidase [Aliikangiella maris]|uniref:M1 family metallopeptidase n=2 Tax=Aliikangiella maris TaxID=3162458 RepID=A0ABV3MJ23_9GAMM